MKIAVLGLPLPVRRVAHLVGLGAGEGGRRVAGADRHLMIELREAAGERPAHHARAPVSYTHLTLPTNREV